LPRNVFVSEADIDKARNLAKRAKYLHLQNYPAEEGILRTMKDSKCSLVIALSDFFGVSPREAARRISRAKTLARIAKKYGVNVQMCTLARNENELREIHETYFIAQIIGVGKKEFSYTAKMPIRGIK
jgi:RNase P/RNase MRP subunit p30